MFFDLLCSNNNCGEGFGTMCWWSIWRSLDWLSLNGKWIENPVWRSRALLTRPSSPQRLCMLMSSDFHFGWDDDDIIRWRASVSLTSWWETKQFVPAAPRRWLDTSTGCHLWCNVPHYKHNVWRCNNVNLWSRSRFPPSSRFQSKQ